VVRAACLSCACKRKKQKQMDLLVVLFRCDLRTDDDEVLHRISTLPQCAERRLLPLYVYDPQLLANECSSTAHHLFIVGDCLNELSERLKATGSGLVYRTGHLVGVLEAFRRLLCERGRFTLNSY
jgi:deoxyribodipyrimidine photolyase